MPFTSSYAIFYAIYPKLCYILCHIPRSSAIFFLNVMLQYITLTPSYTNSSYAMFSGQSQGRILGYCCMWCQRLSSIKVDIFVFYRILVEMMFGIHLLTFTALILVVYFNNFNVSADDGCPGQSSWRCGDTCM